MYTKHAEFKAGIVILLGIAALLAVLWFAAGAESIFGESRYINIRFAQGFVAPKVGDDVMMNGKDIGTVQSIAMVEEVRGVGGSVPLTDLDRLRLGIGDDEAGTYRELYVLCVVKLPEAVIVPAGTRARIEETLTGLRKLHLIPGTEARNLKDAETREVPIPGQAVAGLGDISKKLDQLIDQVSGVVGQGGEVMGEAKALLVLLREKIDAFQTQEMNDEALGMLASLKKSALMIEARIDSIGGNLEDASLDIKKLATQALATVERLDRDLDEASASFKRAMANLDGAMEDVREPLRDILRDIKTAAANAAQVTGEFAGIGPEAKRMIEGLGVDIDTLLRNLIDTSRNLQDTSEDVRAHPWKLLNKPEGDEIAFENLRAAALGYMRAMRDLNDASRRLVALMERDDLEDPEVKKLLDEALVGFQAAQARYRTDEARWQALFRETNPARKAPRKGR